MSVAEFRMPQVLHYGTGAVDKVTEVARLLGKKALIISDPIMQRLGNVDLVGERLHQAGVEFAVYLEVDTEPTNLHVEEALSRFRMDGCDILVAIGGGSCLDAAKAVAVVATNGGAIGDYMGGKTLISHLPVPLIVIPTTAGTGSEVTSVTVITSTQDDVKMMIRHPAFIPYAAIVDPQLTLSSSPQVTAATGVDALCHAIEAYISRRQQPMTDTLALSAIQLISENILLAYRDGQNLKAREKMALAAMQAGLAFTNASVCLVHGMSRPIGAVFHVPHGISNAMLLPSVLEYSMDACTDRLAAIGRMLNKDWLERPDAAVAVDVVRHVKELCRDLDIPNMRGWGLDEAKFEASLTQMAMDAIASGSPDNNPKVPSHEEIMEMYRTAFDADFAENG